jgi:hypothetical protein
MSDRLSDVHLAYKETVPQIGDSTGKDDLVQQQFSDTNFSALIWDLFEDVNWNSNFDVSGMLGATS